MEKGKKSERDASQKGDEGTNKILGDDRRWEPKFFRSGEGKKRVYLGKKFNMLGK